MSENNENSVELKSEIQDKLTEIAKKVDLPLNEVVNASLLFGYSRFWYPLQKYYNGLKVEDQPIKKEDYEPLLSDIKKQIESSYAIVQKIDQFEPKFEKRHPFGTFQDFEERHHEFIKYIEESSKPKEKLIEVPIKREVTVKVVKKVPKKEPTLQEPEVKSKSFFKICVAYLTPQIHGIVDIIELLIFFLLVIIVNYYIFWGLNSIWPIFNLEYFFRYYPIFVPFQFILIPGIILLSSFIIGKLWYYFTNKLGELIKR